VGGSYNGLVGFWDLRKGNSPVESSILENSHHDPVYDVFWIQSRSGNECCSLSTDGQLLWWDIRKLRKGPTDVMLLNSQGADGADCVYGGTAMEYRSDAGATRFLVGSEQGAVLLADRKAKKDSESSKSIRDTTDPSMPSRETPSMVRALHHSISCTCSHMHRMRQALSVLLCVRARTDNKCSFFVLVNSVLRCSIMCVAVCAVCCLQ
jgi:WD40 repeat protein